MSQLNKYFSREEFACKCGCGYNTVDYLLLTYLTEVRKRFGEAVVITSGCRCVSYNKKIGGSPKSQHLAGKAADIVVMYIDPEEVYDFLNPKFYIGLGRYKNFTHIDVRGVSKRWVG